MVLDDGHANITDYDYYNFHKGIIPTRQFRIVSFSKWNTSTVPENHAAGCETAGSNHSTHHSVRM